MLDIINLKHIRWKLIKLWSSYANSIRFYEMRWWVFEFRNKISAISVRTIMKGVFYYRCKKKKKKNLSKQIKLYTRKWKFLNRLWRCEHMVTCDCVNFFRNVLLVILVLVLRQIFVFCFIRKKNEVNVEKKRHLQRLLGYWPNILKYTKRCRRNAGRHHNSKKNSWKT